jgi:hypothetical protein
MIVSLLILTSIVPQVRINWTGLCASDKSLLHDEWAGFGIKMQDAASGIAGHEGAGVVAKVADDLTDVCTSWLMFKFKFEGHILIRVPTVQGKWVIEQA